MSGCGCSSSLAQLIASLQRPVGWPVGTTIPTPASSPALEPAAVGFPAGFQVEADVDAPPEVTAPILAARNLLERALAAAGAPLATITSWYRSPGKNLAEGGKPTSQHLTGTAFDLRADAAGMAVARAWMMLGGVVVDERSSSKPHWHLQLFPAAA